MNIELQLTSLELSKKLENLGVKQESYFVWHTGGKLSGPKFVDELLPSKRPASFGSADSAWRDYPAYSVAELGEMLPHEALGDYLRLYKGKNDWSCAYGIQATKSADTLADAMAKMLIYLIEKGLYKINK